MPAANWTAPNVVEVAMLGRWSNGRPVLNIHFVDYGASFPNVAAEELRDQWQTEVIPLLPNNYTFEGIKYRDRNVAPGVVGTRSPNGALPVVGPGASDVVPPNTCFLIRKSSVLVAGQRTGRMYLPGVPESAVDENGVIAGATVTAITGGVTDFLTGMNASGVGELVLVHFTGPTDATGTKSLIDSMECQGTAATMRRRMRK